MESKPLEPELRIVLMGKTGTGKSASGNTILGSQCFHEETSSSSVTKECSAATRKLNNQTLKVTDTPSLFHTSMKTKEIVREMLRFIGENLQGPHVLLWVIELGEFSKEDEDSINIYKKVFPSAAKFTIVLFTHGHKGEVESFIDKNPNLKRFIEWSNHRYHVFDNTLKGNDGQVEDLVKKINEIAQNEGVYNSDLIKTAQKAMEAMKNESDEQPDGGSKEETLFEKVTDAVMRIVEVECPYIKTFQESLCKWAEIL